MKGGRVRCGGCDRLLHDPRSTMQPHEHKLDRLVSEREMGSPWTHEEIDATIRLAGRSRRHGKVRNRVVDADDSRYLVLTCPGCHVNYAAADFLGRWEAARDRGEDLVLTAGDVDRTGIGDTRQRD